MPAKKDAQWWRDYRARKAELDAGTITEVQAAQALGVDRVSFREAGFEEQLGEFITDRLDGRGIEAILDGIRKGNPDAWRKYVKEANVDENVRKAIEPDQVKVRQRPGKPELSKGLGDIPGDVKREAVRDPSFGAPAPKPGK